MAAFLTYQFLDRSLLSIGLLMVNVGKAKVLFSYLLIVVLMSEKVANI